MDICGDILVAKDIKSFSLRCTLCEKTVQQWEDFVCHIQNFHNPVKVFLDEIWIEADFEDSKENVIAEEIKEEFGAAHSIVKEEDRGEKKIQQEHEFLMDDDDDSDVECTSWALEERLMPAPEAVSEIQENSSSESEDHDNNGDGNNDMDEMLPDADVKLNPSFYIRSPSTTQFIELYKSSPCLWDPNDVNYQNCPVRLEAQQRIIDQMKRNFNIVMTLRSLNGAIMKIRRQYHTTLQMKTQSRTKINAIVREHFDKCSFLSVFDDSPEDITIESNAMKFLMFEEINEATLAFIDAYAGHPILYNDNGVDYSARRKAHLEMVKTLKTQYNTNYVEKDVQNDIYKLESWYYMKIAAVNNEEPNKSQSQVEAHRIYINKLGSFMPAVNKKFQRLYCEICSKNFRSKITLQSHKHKDHGIVETPYKCSNCDRSFQTKNLLTDHQRRSHMEKSLQCEYCERRFSVLSDLRRHVRVHTGEKPYVCELCGRPFAVLSQLKSHTITSHTKVRAFKCTMCPKDFLKNVDLKDHIKAHLNIRDKICETCGKGFTNCHSLIRHRQIHAEVKKFACKLCDARFHQFVGLNSHMKRTHHIVKNKAN